MGSDEIRTTGTPTEPAPPSPPRGAGVWRRRIRNGGLGLVGLLLVIQLVPYGRDHSNPPATAKVTWNSPQTHTLFAAACGDCHSNETTWPWYSNVAPMSWLVQRDVQEGRSAANISTGTGEGVNDMVEKIRSGEMPPWQYTLIHRNAALSSSQKDALIAGLQATFGGAQVQPGVAP